MRNFQLCVATNDGGDVVFGAVTVGADAFVGPAATLLPGAHVRAGAAVGAHAVVGPTWRLMSRSFSTRFG